MTNEELQKKRENAEVEWLKETKYPPYVAAYHIVDFRMGFDACQQLLQPQLEAEKKAAGELVEAFGFCIGGYKAISAPRISAELENAIKALADYRKHLGER